MSTQINDYDVALENLVNSRGLLSKAKSPKVMTVLGTRPEIIRLSRIIPKLDGVCEHVLVHTGQSFDHTMSGVFFDELDLRQPDHYLGVKSTTFGEQVGKIMSGIERVILDEKPDRLLILGDTNSALSAFVAARMGIPVYHMEAGNRCFDNKVPEEWNRKVVDHCSYIHMPYTERSRANLLREGIPGNRIFVVGNPIYEVLQNYRGTSTILSELGIGNGRFILVTAHREENVDVKDRLLSLLTACSDMTRMCPVIFSRHPRTAKMMERYGMDFPSIVFHEPFGFADFLELERNAMVVVTDSGTVQEELSILGIRCVTIRDTTERPETVECGSNILSGVAVDDVLRAVGIALEQGAGWKPPEEYTRLNVSDTVVRIVMGYG